MVLREGEGSELGVGGILLVVDGQYLGESEHERVAKDILISPEVEASPGLLDSQKLAIEPTGNRRPCGTCRACWGRRPSPFRRRKISGRYWSGPSSLQ